MTADFQSPPEVATNSETRERALRNSLMVREEELGTARQIIQQLDARVLSLQATQDKLNVEFRRQRAELIHERQAVVDEKNHSRTLQEQIGNLRRELQADVNSRSASIHETPKNTLSLKLSLSVDPENREMSRSRCTFVCCLCA